VRFQSAIRPDFIILSLFCLKVLRVLLFYSVFVSEISAVSVSDNENVNEPSTQFLFR